MSRWALMKRVVTLTLLIKHITSCHEHCRVTLIKVSMYKTSFRYSWSLVMQVDVIINFFLGVLRFCPCKYAVPKLALQRVTWNLLFVLVLWSLSSINLFFFFRHCSFFSSYSTILSLVFFLRSFSRDILLVTGRSAGVVYHDCSMWILDCLLYTSDAADE